MNIRLYNCPLCLTKGVLPTSDFSCPNCKMPLSLEDANDSDDNDSDNELKNQWRGTVRDNADAMPDKVAMELKNCHKCQKELIEDFMTSDDGWFFCPSCWDKINPDYSSKKIRITPERVHIRMNKSMTTGVLFAFVGLLPVVLPTTYFRLSPLALPVRQHQNNLIRLSMCEVCGESATEKEMLPYKATRNRLGQYVGYNPKIWPGSAEILLCREHVGYFEAAKARRLTHRALTYLLLRGNNSALQLVLIVHSFVLVGGAFIIFKTIIRKDVRDW